MNKRESLELAARYWGAAQFPEDGVWEYFFERDFISGPEEFKEWNPSSDDGDALRLAVKLRLSVSWDVFDGDEYATATPRQTNQGYDCIVDGDPRAAIRWAIVKAAAEMQRSNELKAKSKPETR